MADSAPVDDWRPPSRTLTKREIQDGDHGRDCRQEQQVYQVFVVVTVTADDFHSDTS